MPKTTLSNKITNSSHFLESIIFRCYMVLPKTSWPLKWNVSLQWGEQGFDLGPNAESPEKGWYVVEPYDAISIISNPSVFGKWTLNTDFFWYWSLILIHIGHSDIPSRYWAAKLFNSRSKRLSPSSLSQPRRLGVQTSHQESGSIRNKHLIFLYPPVPDITDMFDPDVSSYWFFVLFCCRLGLTLWWFKPYRVPPTQCWRHELRRQECQRQRHRSTPSASPTRP